MNLLELLDKGSYLSVVKDNPSSIAYELILDISPGTVFICGIRHSEFQNRSDGKDSGTEKIKFRGKIQVVEISHMCTRLNPHGTCIVIGKS